jgi:hypothetical protein
MQFDWHAAALAGCLLTEHPYDPIVSGVDQPFQLTDQLSKSSVQVRMNSRNPSRPR